MPPREPESTGGGDLSITALYTAGTWRWSEVPCAELVSPRGADRVFRATNAALDVARAVRHDLPSLRHSLAQRHAMINHLVRAADNPQVLELAAGLSPRGAATSVDRAVRYVEVDLPAVVGKKRILLAGTAAGRSVLARPNLRLVPGSVFDLELGDLVDPARPVTIVVEGLFVYLDATQRLELWRRLAEIVGGVAGSQLVFDLVPPAEEPQPGVVGRVMESAMKRFTGGRGFERDDSTREQLVDELRTAGFSGERIEAFEPQDVGDEWGIPHRDQATQVVVWRCG